MSWLCRGKTHHESAQALAAPMIPAPLFSGAFLAILGISFLATVAVLLWVVTLTFSPDARRAFRARWIRKSVLLGVLCWMSSLFVALAIAYLKIDLDARKKDAAEHPTLEKTTRLMGIDMPPGTQLSLGTAGDMHSFDTAVFPREVDVYGIPAKAVEVRSEFDDEAPRNDRNPVHLTALGLTITGPRSLDGWVCDAGQPMEIVLRNDARTRSLWWCRLADGNRIADAIVPAGSDLIRDTTTYGDGLRDDDYWRIDVAQGGVFQLAGLALHGARLRLDRQHRIVAFTSATLARAIDIGGIHYPAGTAVSSALRGLREKYPGAWVFTPTRSQPAISKTNGPIAEGMSIVQAPSGKTYALVRDAAY
ncbi:hypothetical protein [Burkholderia sp. HI2714]|uniref:hypothetical protein n=1 Tax=Burkholderia sp. HI2714 TaxID=2015359 RepID=UPI00117C7D2B|nr:hypothetical protein [Burkholderia sp. HI2714]